MEEQIIGTDNLEQLKGRVFQSSTVPDSKGVFYHFGIVPSLASVYGNKPEDIVQVSITIAEDQTIPENDSDGKEYVGDYWGWFDFNEQRFSMIYPRRFLLNMCFAYGIEASEERGHGKAFRLVVIQSASQE